MNKKQIEKEWKRLKYEIHKNKPNIVGPYPPAIVKSRELLLFAQVHLSNIISAKNKNDKNAEKFETEIYNTIMSTYYKWGNEESTTAKV